MKDQLKTSGADAVIERLKKGLEGRAEAYEIILLRAEGLWREG